MVPGPAPAPAPRRIFTGRDGFSQAGVDFHRPGWIFTGRDPIVARGGWRCSYLWAPCEMHGCFDALRRSCHPDNTIMAPADLFPAVAAHQGDGRQVLELLIPQDNGGN